MYNQYDAIIADASARYGIPALWIKAVIGTESTFDERAYRPEPRINDASIGLMQILMSTARGLGFTGTEAELYNPVINIDLGAKYLAELVSRYGTDFRRIYSAYNSGNPDAYLTSAEVARNTARAEEWLKRIAQNGVAVSEAGVPLLLALAFAGFFILKR